MKTNNNIYENGNERMSSLEIAELSDEREDPVLGWDTLPPPALYPRKHRELLRALVSVRLGISKCKVNLRALDKAYSAPTRTPHRSM